MKREFIDQAIYVRYRKGSDRCADALAGHRRVKLIADLHFGIAERHANATVSGIQNEHPRFAVELEGEIILLPVLRNDITLCILNALPAIGRVSRQRIGTALRWVRVGI